MDVTEEQHIDAVRAHLIQRYQFLGQTPSARRPRAAGIVSPIFSTAVISTAAG
ncbi:hypothetical protein [Rhodococcus wratislaviensis]|uniref:hypothetical protein n=1 Tax=Rhodococcus wratislaviensis TaxID=44752 RepID=UPI003647E179